MPSTPQPNPGRPARYVLRRRPGVATEVVNPLQLDVDFSALVQSAQSNNPGLSIEEDLGVMAAAASHHPESSHTTTPPVTASTSAESTYFLASPATSVPPLTSSASSALPSTISNDHAKRRNKRRHPEPSEYPQKPTKRIRETVIGQSAPVQTSINIADIRAAKGGQTGRKGTKEELGSKEDREREYDVDELKEMGFSHYQWDGITPSPILADGGEVCGVCAGRPKDPTYMDDLHRTYEQMKEHVDEVRRLKDEKEAKKGTEKATSVRGKDFVGLHSGVLMGMGSKKPVGLKNEGAEHILDSLMTEKGVRRIAGYHGRSLATWAPKLSKKYEDTLDQTVKRYNMRRNFRSNPFAAITFNFGRTVRTFKHRDHMNYGYGWCAITALGRFDPQKSARLVLWELKLVIDFPAGSTILIPSAIITHSNTRISIGDERMSITEFSAGGLFRFVENGFMTEEELRKKVGESEWAKREAKKMTAHMEKISQFSRLAELVESVD